MNFMFEMNVLFNLEKREQIQNNVLHKKKMENSLSETWLQTVNTNNSIFYVKIRPFNSTPFNKYYGPMNAPIHFYI